MMHTKRGTESRPKGGEEQVMGITEERSFQVEGRASAKTLRQDPAWQV